jgi:NADPH-dependent 2,4-dienoyl-CoA reductase/sulfur reductase-like enzyme
MHPALPARRAVIWQDGPVYFGNRQHQGERAGESLMRQYVIIGSGPAGIAAAESIRCYDSSSIIILISEDPHGYYSRPGLAYLLSNEIPEKRLFPFSSADLKKLYLHWLKTSAVRVVPAAHNVELKNGQTVHYDRLLIATGASAIQLSIPGAESEGVVKLDHMEDARGILKKARRGRKAVVTGGGITALEIVEGLASRGVSIHYILRGERYWPGVLDETESAIIEHRLMEEKVHLHKRTEIVEVLEKKGRVAGVRTSAGKTIDCDLVAAAIGIRPRLDLARSASLETDRGILVNEMLETSQPDIFAAGDVAQVFDPLTGRSVLDSLWGPAREQGRSAGFNMAGASKPYRKALVFNVTRLAGLTTTIIGSLGTGSDPDLIGIARGDSEVYRQLPDAIAAQDSFDVNRLRLMLNEKAILGALVMGDQTLSRPLQELVAAQADITSVRSQLLSDAVPLGKTIAEFWTTWKRGESIHAER